MSDQNSTVAHQIRPDALMDEIGIKKDAYYAYLKHLGIKAGKDSEGKAYLEEEQANLVRLLRSHVQDGGKIDEFSISNLEESGDLVKAEETELAQESAAPCTEEPVAPGFDVDELVRGAAELAGHRMTMAQQLMLNMANQMTYDDLPEDVKAKVDDLREATSPKHQNLSAIASQLLTKWRSQRSQNPQPEAMEAAA